MYKIYDNTGMLIGIYDTAEEAMQASREYQEARK